MHQLLQQVCFPLPFFFRELHQYSLSWKRSSHSTPLLQASWATGQGLAAGMSGFAGWQPGLQDQTRPNPTCAQPSSGAISQAIQARQRELSEPWGFHCHYPRGSQASSAHRHACCTADLAGLQWTVPRGCSQHPKDTLSFLQGTLVPENATDGAAQTRLPTHAALCWLILDVFQPSGGEISGVLFFLQATSQLKTFLKLAGALFPFSATENSLLWRALGIHDALWLRLPKRGICKGTSSRLWNYCSCLTAGKGAVYPCPQSIRALHHVPFGNCCCTS